MADDYYCGTGDRKEYTSKGQGVLNTILGILGTIGGAPAVAHALGGDGIMGGGNKMRQSQLETEIAFEKGKNYTDQTVITALRDGEATRKEITQQVVATKEELAKLQERLACQEKYQKEIDCLREKNTKLEIQAAIGAAVNPLREDIVRLRDGTLSLRQELVGMINLEAERRCCADNKVVSYSNATFAQKMITGYTADATTTTLAQIGNPLCGCCGGNGNAA